MHEFGRSTFEMIFEIVFENNFQKSLEKEMNGLQRFWKVFSDVFYCWAVHDKEPRSLVTAYDPNVRRYWSGERVPKVIRSLGDPSS